MRRPNNGCFESDDGWKFGRRDPTEGVARAAAGREGDSLYVIETKQGIELTPYNPEFTSRMEAAERVMREDRDALRKLAE